MNSDSGDDKTRVTLAGKIVVAIFGLAFLGIGVTVLWFMWSQPFDDFHSPPLFFRIFASFIAICFIAMGGGTAYAALNGTSQMNNLQATVQERLDQRRVKVSDPDRPPVTRDAYVCPQCSAPLGDQADVSPHGDAKCTHCKSWFNVHAGS